MQIHTRYTPDIYQKYIRCTPDIHQMYTRYTSDVHQIYAKHTRDMNFLIFVKKQSQELTRVNPDRTIFSINVELTDIQIYTRYLPDIPVIYQIYIRYTPDIHQAYTPDKDQIYTRYTPDIYQI